MIMIVPRKCFCLNVFEAAQLGDSDNLASERSIFHLEIHSHFPSARRTGGRFKKYFQDILTDLI